MVRPIRFLTLCFIFVCKLLSANDPGSFSAAGKVSMDVGNDDSGRATAYMSDGRVVIGGTVDTGTERNFLVIRVHPDGNIDNTFDTDGAATIDVQETDIVHAILIDTADDKILLVGSSSKGGYKDLALVRLLTDGALDTTFHIDGIYTSDIGNSEFGRGASFTTTAGEKKYAIFGNVNEDFAIFRFASNGILDTAFNIDGVYTLQVSGDADIAMAGGTQSNEKLIAAGHAKLNEGHNFTFIRVNTDGSADTTFDIDGLYTAVDKYHNYIFGFDVGSEDKMSAVGSTGYNDGNSTFSVLRINSNATVDTAFDVDGYLTQHIANNLDSLRYIQFQTDAKMLTGGIYEKSNGSDWEFGMFRYNSNGTLDTTFDNDGIFTQALNGTNEDMSFALRWHYDGATWSIGKTKNTDYDISILRYDVLGKTDLTSNLDVTFSDDGCVSLEPGTGDERFYGMAMQADGKIILVGHDSGTDAIIARLEYDGTLDTTFSVDGLIVSNWGGTDLINAVTLQDDGKIVISGEVGGQIGAQRFNSNGTVDTTFSIDGRTTLSVSSNIGRGVVVDINGKIAVSAINGGNFIVNRWNSNGTTDTSFSVDGVTDSPGGAAAAFQILVDRQHRYVIGGTSASSQMAIWRINSDGSDDTSFDVDGYKTYTSGITDYVYGMTITSEDKILLAGYVQNSDNDTFIARFNTDGSLDTTFENDGLASKDLLSAHEYIYGIAVATNGKVIVTGHHTGGSIDYVTARFLSNGQIDTAFDNDGLQTYNVASNGDVAHAPFFQTNGQIMIVGSGNNGAGGVACRIHP